MFIRTLLLTLALAALGLPLADEAFAGVLCNDGQCASSSSACKLLGSSVKFPLRSCSTASGSDGGDFDAAVNCVTTSGWTSLADDNGVIDLTRWTKEARALCTFTDTGPDPDFQESAICTVRVEYTNLTPVPATGDDHTVNITGVVATTQNPGGAAMANSFID